ncbi:esterase/lipase family protein [Streptomyces sp. NPDC021093]|uniref:esterase/lipase family protein n=1 Tax=Streptomyces sp. NPDC021093 TaxID=3365112 RepID=UPI00378D49B4
MSAPVVNFWGDLDPRARAAFPEAPRPDETWPLQDGGTAWVYRVPGRRAIQKPVILSDGFSSLPSSYNELHFGLEGDGSPDYKFISALHQRGHDLVLLGYEDRTKSIIENAKVATECIHTALSHQEGNAPLTVGGFSMGGLITRYALADMERRRMNHHTALYVSYDTPHRGVWLPIGIQKLIPYLLGDSRMLGLVSSPAAKQMMRWHTERVQGEPGMHDDRKTFLQQLERVGGWPQVPRLIGVANGDGNGIGNGIKPDQLALSAEGDLSGTRLYTQQQGRGALVAELAKTGTEPIPVRTDTIPEMDGAPGGTLVNFELVAQLLSALGAPATAHLPATCFVPTGSAVDLLDFDLSTPEADPFADLRKVPEEQSGLHAFLCAPTSTVHTTMTPELGSWIVSQLPG